VAGRVIGILADESSDLAAVTLLAQGVTVEGMTALVIGPHGGRLGMGTPDEVPVQRTLLTTRSVEFDAVLVAGSPAPDPRISLLLGEAFRHCKALGGFGGAEAVFAASGIPDGSTGVVLGSDPIEVLAQVIGLLGEHRVWDRFPVTAG